MHNHLLQTLKLLECDAKYILHISTKHQINLCLKQYSLRYTNNKMKLALTKMEKPFGTKYPRKDNARNLLQKASPSNKELDRLTASFSKRQKEFLCFFTMQPYH
ncbi:hypothetical protein EUGRSUZ_G01130 [Eucalyptus grandis]|uniref:Uncharacterized protein n=2 Tax=Eucalyptus grandis TaxID=71139 RepID=A0ACC3K265_EUCGR|nr:hypothetical protein EUGRSUZ_G01130 [Eucalyptus grandis]